MTREFHWKYTPGCPCGDCKEYEREREPAFKFQKMEDERAEFEATFRDSNVGDFDLTRTSKPYNEFDDYVSADTSLAWAGWLKGARVEWVPTP